MTIRTCDHHCVRRTYIRTHPWPKNATTHTHTQTHALTRSCTHIRTHMHTHCVRTHKLTCLVDTHSHIRTYVRLCVHTQCTHICIRTRTTHTAPQRYLCLSLTRTHKQHAHNLLTKVPESYRESSRDSFTCSMPVTPPPWNSKMWPLAATCAQKTMPGSINMNATECRKGSCAAGSFEEHCTSRDRAGDATTKYARIRSKGHATRKRVSIGPCLNRGHDRVSLAGARVVLLRVDFPGAPAGALWP